MSVRYRLAWPLLYMAALFAAAAIPGEVPGEEIDGLAGVLAWVSPGVQNLLHVPAYGLLAWLWFRALEPVRSMRFALAAGIGLTLCHGLALEWYQAHVPGRFGSATDAAADGLGAVIAAAVYAARGSPSRE